MHVVFHSDAIVSTSRFGLARYAWELFAALSAGHRELTLVPFSSRVDRRAEHLAPLRQHGFVHPGWSHRTLVMNWATLGYPGVERWVPGADLVHTLELDYPVATRKPWLVTVHDLGPLTHPEFFSQSHRWLRRRGLKAAASHAEVIMAVSEATAEAIEHLAGSAVLERVRVIPEAVNATFFSEPPAECLAALDALPPAGTPFFLWAGSMNPRKNLGTVLDAFEAVAGRVDEHLVLVGGLAWDNDGVLERIRQSPYGERIHRPGFVTDEQLRALYRQATAFVYVSLLEGFGLPILEAMASECPVITSSLSSMPEVAGDAALLVDPRDKAAVANAMHALAVDSETARRCRHDGRQRAREFSWDKVAAAIADVYEQASSRVRGAAA